MAMAMARQSDRDEQWELESYPTLYMQEPETHLARSISRERLLQNTYSSEKTASFFLNKKQKNSSIVESVSTKNGISSGYVSKISLKNESTSQIRDNRDISAHKSGDRNSLPLSEVRSNFDALIYGNQKYPYVCWGVSVSQIVVLIVALIKNSLLTGSLIEIKPTFNPLIGPSQYVLINLGARFQPCMHNIPSITDQAIGFPCPNTTSLDGPFTCSLSQLCGFAPIPLGTVPNQVSTARKIQPAIYLI